MPWNKIDEGGYKSTFLDQREVSDDFPRKKTRLKKKFLLIVVASANGKDGL